MPSLTLRERLRTVIQAPSVSHSAPTLSADVAPSAHACTLEEALGGEWRHAGSTRSFVVTRRYEADTRYGRHRVGDFHAELQRAAGAASLLGVMAQPPFVFFDLETTGLNGGAGTYAFLVGCARFESDGAFVVEQHVMADYAAERSMLQVVAADLASAGTLVTFNGKSFDAPLVETRYLFHRHDSPCALLPHLDMLHPARRFWSATAVEGCSLGTLEARILGARRSGDVPGMEIPARYFHFVRTGDAQPLAAVLEHNRLDLLSLAGLSARLLSMVEDGPDTARNPHELLALGRVYDRAGVPPRASEAFERTVAACGSRVSLAGVKAEALRALAIDARRRRRYDRSAAYWQQLVDLPGCPMKLAHEGLQSLSIHHEHRVRDLELAKQFALKSANLNAGSASGDATRHRLARIDRKLISEKRPLFPSSPSQPVCGSLRSVPRTSS